MCFPSNWMTFIIQLEGFFQRKKNMKRVDVTTDASTWIQSLSEKNGPLMFHQSGGCCDGSSPMCYPKDVFLVGSSDVYLGDVSGTPFFMSEVQFRHWQHTHLTLDIVPGRGSGFSLEVPFGVRFLIRSRLFTDDEWAQITPTISGDQWLAKEQQHTPQ